MPVRALIAEEDLNLHQVVHDILEMSFKDLRIERAMNYDSLLNVLRQDGAELDLILYDLRFDSSSGQSALSIIRNEMPELLPRLVILAANGDELRAQEEARGLAYVLHPFSLDDFTDTVKRVYDRAAAEEDESEAGNDKEKGAN